MEQGFSSFWMHSHIETIARKQDLANLVNYHNTIAPSTDPTQPSHQNEAQPHSGVL